MLSLCIIFVVLRASSYCTQIFPHGQTAKQSGFFSKSVKKVELGVRVSRARNARALHALHAHPQPQSRCPFSASFQTFCLTARAYLDAQNTDCLGCENKNGGYFTLSKSNN